MLIPDQPDLSPDEFRSCLLRYAQRRHARDPEEAAQEVWMRALQNTDMRPAVQWYLSPRRPQGQPPIPIKQFLRFVYVTCEYVLREEYRQRGRQTKQTPIDSIEISAPFDRNADSTRQEIELAMQEVDKLEPEKGEIFRAYLDGEKFEDMPKKFGMSLPTVRNVVFRTRKYLQRLLRKKNTGKH
jgi:DNA-directed RNA polymerase specialized sigma24 family protein